MGGGGVRYHSLLILPPKNNQIELRYLKNYLTLFKFKFKFTFISIIKNNKNMDKEPEWRCTTYTAKYI